MTDACVSVEALPSGSALLAGGGSAPMDETGTFKGSSPDALRTGALQQDRCTGNMLGPCIMHVISNAHGVNLARYGY